MLDSKSEKQLHKLCVKMNYVFNDIYILKQGYVISLDKEKPFIIQLGDKDLMLFSDLVGEFKILHIPNLKDFKKDMENNIQEVTSTKEQKEIINLLNERIKALNDVKHWKEFILSNNEEENEKLIYSLFANNDYINFKSDEDDSELILTKSLLPLVSEKNYDDLNYSSQKVDTDLYLMIFDFQFEMFRLYMFHYYIDVDAGKKKL